MQAIGPLGLISKIDKFSCEAREHFSVVYDSIEVVYSLQFPYQMKGNLHLACLDIQGRIPRSSAWAVKPIAFSRSKVGECGIDKVCVRQPSNQLVRLQVFSSLLLSRQAPAGCPVNFDKIVLIPLTGELQQHGITQAGGGDEPNSPFQGDAQNRERHARYSPPRKAST